MASLNGDLGSIRNPIYWAWATWRNSEKFNLLMSLPRNIRDFINWLSMRKRRKKISPRGWEAGIDSSTSAIILLAYQVLPKQSFQILSYMLLLVIRPSLQIKPVPLNQKSTSGIYLLFGVSQRKKLLIGFKRKNS